MFAQAGGPGRTPPRQPSTRRPASSRRVQTHTRNILSEVSWFHGLALVALAVVVVLVLVLVLLLWLWLVWLLSLSFVVVAVLLQTTSSGCVVQSRRSPSHSRRSGYGIASTAHIAIVDYHQ